MRSGVGARSWVPDGIDPFVFLFSESTARVLVVVPRSEELRFTEMCGARGFRCARIGVVDSGLGAEHGTAKQLLVVDNVAGGQIVIGIDELRTVHTATLPALFGGTETP